jgi:putative Mn2+ efflux pump MntP
MMVFLELVLLGIVLSFDTFAVSISTGLKNSRIVFREAVGVAFVLAFFQALMPFIGWLGGSQIEKYIKSSDHWIAFGLLFLLGLKMISEAFKTDEGKKSYNPMLLTALVAMALATSIDALVVGVSLAFVDYNIYLAIGIIGIITFLVSMIGMLLGKSVNGRFGKKAEIAGGIMLIAIGVKILLSHLLS